MGGEDPAANLRLSRKEFERLIQITSSYDDGMASLGYKLGEDIARDSWLVVQASTGGAFDPSALAEIQRGAGQKFPVKAADLMPDLQGAQLGAALAGLEQLWIDSDFALSREDLLASRG